MPRRKIQLAIENLGYSKFLLLLLSLVLLIFIAPYFIGQKFNAWLLGLFSTLVLFTLVLTLIEEKKHFILAIILSIAIVVSNLVELFYYSYTADFVHCFLSLVFYVIVIVVIARYILQEKQVTHDTVYGALALYLLLALAYANAYYLTELTNSGSFAFNHDLGEENNLNLMNFIYFSFTTLTTVGFGDILAITIKARAIVILEEVTGVLYLAALVSRLVAIMRD